MTFYWTVTRRVRYVFHLSVNSTTMKLNLVQRPLWNILLTNHEKLKNQDFMDRVSLHSRSKMKKPLDKIYFYVKKKK